MTWSGILCRTKYKSNTEHKPIYNYAMHYFTVLMKISTKVLEDLENNKTNLWPECNFMALNRMMLNMWTK